MKCRSSQIKTWLCSVIAIQCDCLFMTVLVAGQKPVVHAKGHMPNAPVVFENVWISRKQEVIAMFRRTGKR